MKVGGAYLERQKCLIDRFGAARFQVVGVRPADASSRLVILPAIEIRSDLDQSTPSGNVWLQHGGARMGKVKSCSVGHVTQSSSLIQSTVRNPGAGTGLHLTDVALDIKTNK